MILSDKEIADRIQNGDLEIEPFASCNIEPSSVDLRLGTDFVIYREKDSSTKIDTRDGSRALDRAKSFSGQLDRLVVKQGDFVLAETKEKVSIPPDLAATVAGRSSLGRLGVEIHKTAGYVDPGFSGTITLEIANSNPNPVALYPDQRVAQIIFSEVSSWPQLPYGHDGSQYQGQSGPTESGMRF